MLEKMRLRKKKVIAVLIVAVLITSLLPVLFNLTHAEIEIPPTDSKVFEDLEELLEEKESRYAKEGDELWNETQGQIDAMEFYDLALSREEIDESIEDSKMMIPTIPYIFAEAELFGIDQIIDTIIYGRSYLVFTNVSGHGKWTTSLNYDGPVVRRPLIRLDLPLPVEELYETWIDVDDDGIWDVGILFKVKLTLVNFEIDPFDPSNSKYYFTGKISIDIEKMNLNFDEPIELYILRPFGYVGNTFIWAVGLNFSALSEDRAFSIRLDVGEIVLNSPLTGINPDDPGQITFWSIKGPYNISIYTDKIPKFGLMVGYAKLEEGHLTERSWIKVDIKSLPKYLNLHLKSESWDRSFDEIELNLDETVPYAVVQFYEERDNITYLYAEIWDIPTRIFLSEDNVTDEDSYHTEVHYEATGKVGKIDYNEYTYYYITYDELVSAGRNDEKVDYLYTYFQVSDLPTVIDLSGTFEAGHVYNETIVSDNLTNIIARIVDTAMYNVAKKFYTAGKTLRAIPDSVMNMPAEDGWVILDAKEPIGEVNFLVTSERYISRQGQFIGFYNDTRGVLWKNASISGRITGLHYAYAIFGNETEINLVMKNDESLKIIYAEDENYAQINISNIPGWVNIRIADDTVSYSAIERIEEITYTSDVSGNVMIFKINDVPNLTFTQSGEDLMKLEAEDYIDNLEFVITNGMAREMKGDFMMIYQDNETNMISGRIEGIKSIIYNSGNESHLEAYLRGGQNLQIVMINKTGSDKNNWMDARAIIKPLPSHISADLSSVLAGAEIEFPNVMNATSVTDFGSLIYSIANLGTDIIKTMNEVTKSVVSSLGVFGSNFTVSYESDSNMDVVASIIKGDESLLEETEWTHGASVRQRLVNGTTIMNSKVYLQGLPKNVEIKGLATERTIYIEAHLEDYSPKYEWMLLDLKGIQDKDLLVYINNLTQNLTFDLKIDLYTNLEHLPEVSGTIEFLAKKGENLQGLGQMYLTLREENKEPLIAEIFAPTIPSEFKLNLNIKTNMSINYQASKQLPYLWLNVLKSVDGDWHKIFALLNDVPRELSFEQKVDTEFDMDEPLMMQGFPEMEMSASDDSLDLYMYIDGRALGRRTSYELYLSNAPREVKISNEDNVLRIKGSEAIPFMSLRTWDYPMSREYYLGSLDIYAEKVKRVDVKFIMLFGKFPIIELSNCDGGLLQLSIDHEFTVFGNRMKGNVALVDAVVQESNGVALPTATSVQYNSLSTNLGKDSRHYIIPDPLSSAIATLFG